MRYLDVKLGPLLVGTFLNVVLLGVMIMQVYIYLRQFWQKDERWLKFIVLFLLFADMVNSALDVTFLYQYTIAHFGGYAAIRASYWNFNSDPIVTVILSSVCQIFFAWRIKLLSRRNWFFIVLLILILIQFLMGIATTITATVVKTWVFDNSKLHIMVIIWLGCSLVTNLVLAAGIVWRKGYGTLDTLGEVIKLTLQAGLITAIWTAVDLILYLTLVNPLHLVFGLSLGNLYTNLLMSAFNSRDKWKRGMGNDNRITLQKVAVGGSDISMSIRPQRVIWEAGMDGGSNLSGYDHFGFKNPPENGILVTSSTIVHRDRADDEDQSDIQVSEDPRDLTINDQFVNPSSSSHLIHPTSISTH